MSAPSIEAVTVAVIIPEVEPTVAAIAPAASARKHRSRWSLVIQLAALGGVAALLSTQSSILAQSVHALGHLTWFWLPVILVAEFSSMGAVARGYRRLLRSVGEDLSLTSLLAVTYASNAIAVTLPLAGSGVATGFSFRQFNRRGVDSAAAGWALLLSGIAAATTFALLTVLGLAATGRRNGVFIAIVGGLSTVAPTIVALLSLRRKGFRVRLEAFVTRALRCCQRIAHRPMNDLAVKVTDFIERLGELRLTGRDGSVVLSLAMWNWAADLACLVAALKAVGAPVPWHGVLLAYVVGMGVGSLNLTPGGIGVVEVALTSALVANGLPARQALAAVLLYRLVSLWLVVIMGWGAFLWGVRHGGDTLAGTELELIQADLALRADAIDLTIDPDLIDPHLIEPDLIDSGVDLSGVGIPRPAHLDSARPLEV